jgi:sugar lactone lactonase YvrE
MAVHSSRNAARRIVLRVALLPLMAVVVTAAAEFTAYEHQEVPGVAVQAATLPTPVPPPALPAIPAKANAPHFLAPAGVAVRGTTIYMSDVPTNAIWAYDSATKATRLITGSLGPGYSGNGGPAGDAQLMGPRGLAFDPAGNLFIADSGNHVIRRIAASDGTITTVAGAGSRGFSGDGGPATRARLNTPDGVAFDAAGNLFIADTLNHRIRKVNRAGTIVTVAGSGAISTVGHSTGGFGFSGDGGPAVYAQLSIPEGVAVDTRGNIYIADTGNDRIRKVDTKGIIRTLAGTGNNPYSGDGGPATRANLYAPVGIAIGPGGSVYFSERYQQTVRMITARGVMVPVAGRGGSRGGTGDGGYAVRAKLDDPQGIAFGPAGELYVADTGNRRIRVVWPDRTIGSLA